MRERHFYPFGAAAPEELQHDPAKLLKHYETAVVAALRDQTLVRDLQTAGQDDLADDLQRGLDGRQPLPEWSHGAYRDLRRWLTDAATTLAYEAKKETGHLGVTASIIPAGLMAPLGGLSAIAPRRARETNWKALDKAIRGYRAIGGLDVSFNELAGRNQLPGHYQVQLAFAVLGFPLGLKVPGTTSRGVES